MENIIELKNLVKETIKKFEHLSIMIDEYNIDGIFDIHEKYNTISNLDDLFYQMVNYITSEYFLFYQDAMEYLAKYDCSLLKSFNLLNNSYQDVKPFLEMSSTTLANILLYDNSLNEFSEFTQTIRNYFNVISINSITSNDNNFNY